MLSFSDFIFSYIIESLNQIGNFQAGITDDFDYIELSSFPLSSSHEADTARQLVEDEA